MNEQIKQRIEQIRRGEVPEGYKKTKVGVIPNEWELCTISDCLEKVDNPVSVESDTVYTQIGIRSHGKGLFYKEPITGKELGNKSVFWIEPNCFVLNIVFAWEQAFGKTTNNEIGMIASHRFPMYRPINNSVDLDYLICYFLTKRGTDILDAASPGGAGRNRTLGQDRFIKSKIMLPPLAEQQKIAEILSVQDRIIELYGRKIEELERQKKAFMQKMFPQKGESVPRLRFPQFTGPWEEREFGTMFKRRTERNNGQFDNTRWISVAKMYFQEAEKVSSNNIDTRTYVMRRGDIAFEGHSNTEYKYGRFVANDIGDGVISELFPIYMHIDDYDESYWKYAIQIENIMAPKLLRCIEISYTSSNKLDENFFLKESILVPSISEQQQIGLFFRSMDNLIKVNQQKLDQEKQKKKALMQLLLTGIVRVTN